MTSTTDPPGPLPGNSDRFRWQALFHHSPEPIYLLSGRRRVLFVNRAWEALTGLSLADVKGQVCRRRPRGILAEKTELILGTMAPPPEVIAMQSAQTRRLVSTGLAPAWWQITFFPVRGDEGPFAILARISVLPIAPSAAALPVSEKVMAVRQQQAQHFHLDRMVADTPVMKRAQAQIRLAASLRVPVLFVGPPGSGKHWAARAIQELSPQREQAFACLDCACVPADLLADLLLGDMHLPSLGAIHLKNLGSLTRDLQERLLLRLEAEEGTGPRILAGLDDDPQGMVRDGRLLHELYCRLSALVIHLPPLKERMDDFTGWIAHFLARANRMAERDVSGVSAEALLLLRAHSWPGNLRELYETLQAACLRAKSGVIEASDLPFYMRHGAPPPEKTWSLDVILEEVERRMIAQALRIAGNNKSRAAELLSIWRARLIRRMENLGIGDQ